MQGYDHNPGGVVEYHFFENVAFWLSPQYWLDFNNLVGPGIYLPRLENPLFAIPIALFARRAWQLSEPRWRRYFLAAFLPLLALFIPFGFADMFRNFSLAFPAMTLIALSAVGHLDEVLGRRSAKTSFDVPHVVAPPELDREFGKDGEIMAADKIEDASLGKYRAAREGLSTNDKADHERSANRWCTCD
jgi:hypothetical protein